MALIIALILTLMLPTLGFAQQQTGTVNAGLVLNARSGPGTSNGVVAKLNGGTTVTILGADASGAWYRITSNAFSGEAWVAAAYISTSVALSAAAAPNSNASGATVTVRSGRINVRSGPGTSNGVFNKMSAPLALKDNDSPSKKCCSL